MSAHYTGVKIWSRLLLQQRLRSKILGFIIALMLPLNLLHADAIYPLQTAKQEAQFKHLLSELRCLVCQNQDLADSNAELAKDLRLQVYQCRFCCHSR